MKRLGQILAIISSLCLLVGLIYYRVQAVRGTDELTRIKVMPSSKIGTAIEMESTDWSGKYPTATDASLTPGYLKRIPSPTPGWTPNDKSGPVMMTPPSPSPAIEELIER